MPLFPEANRKYRVTDLRRTFSDELAETDRTCEAHCSAQLPGFPLFGAARMQAKANFCAVRLQEETIMSYQDTLSSTEDETPPNF
jgi:hypothetical protein